MFMPHQGVNSRLCSHSFVKIYYMGHVCFQSTLLWKTSEVFILVVMNYSEGLCKISIWWKQRKWDGHKERSDVIVNPGIGHSTPCKVDVYEEHAVSSGQHKSNPCLKAPLQWNHPEMYVTRCEFDFINEHALVKHDYYFVKQWVLENRSIFSV